MTVPGLRLGMVVRQTTLIMERAGVEAGATHCRQWLVSYAARGDLSITPRRIFSRVGRRLLVLCYSRERWPHDYGTLARHPHLQFAGYPPAVMTLIGGIHGPVQEPARRRYPRRRALR